MYYTEIVSKDRHSAWWQVADLLHRCGLQLPAGVDLTVGVFDDSLRSERTSGGMQGMVDSVGVSNGSVSSGGTISGGTIRGGASSGGVIGGDMLVAAGSLKGDMIQGVAVDPAHQGEDLLARLLTGLIGEANRRGLASLYLFTKPEKSIQFQGLGFRQAAVARPYAALLEWGAAGIDQYVAQLKQVRQESEAKLRQTEQGDGDITAGAIVMNANPFTRGHRYLAERAAAQVDILYILVVEEEASQFAFRDRLEMVKLGTADIPNVTVLGGGRYAVSSLTFPSYFTGEEKAAYAHAAMDAELFAKYIAPALGVSRRFVGSEPFSQVTDIYNEALKARLPRSGIEVQQLERLKTGGSRNVCGGGSDGNGSGGDSSDGNGDDSKDGGSDGSSGMPISASRVRALLAESGKEEDLAFSERTLSELEKLVPPTTLNYLKKMKAERGEAQR